MISSGLLRLRSQRRLTFALIVEIIVIARSAINACATTVEITASAWQRRLTLVATVEIIAVTLSKGENHLNDALLSC